MRRRLGACLLLLALAVPLASAEAEGVMQVLGLEGTLRLFRFETEPWPLEPGSPLPDNSRVELDAGAKLRLRYAHYLDFALVGPARLTVYVVPAPTAGEFDEDRVVLKLDEGALFCDGRFQFGRPADIVLSLPDRSLRLPRDARFFTLAQEGRAQFFLPVSSPARSAWPAAVSPNGSLQLLLPAKTAKYAPPLPPGLIGELDRPVRVFVLGRDYNQDLGTWPRPAVLGPLLAERLAKVAGLTVVEGSGDTYYAYRANGALKSGQDFFLKEMGRARGARWVVAGNCVVETPAQSGGPGERSVQGQAEVRLLETEGDAEGLELVSEAANTRVARAGRPIELAAREAFEAASDEVSGYVSYHLQNLLAGRAHAETLLRLVVEDADPLALQALRARLAGLDSVQRVFRRSYSKKTAAFDLMLRKEEKDFQAQWDRAEDRKWRFAPLEARVPGERRYKAEALR